MATYSINNFLGTPINGDVTIKLYDKTKKLRYEINPNIAYFYTKSNIVVIRIEDKNDIYLDFDSQHDAGISSSMLNDAKKIILLKPEDGGGGLSVEEQRKMGFFHSLSKKMISENQSIKDSKYKSSHNVRVIDLWGSDIIPNLTKQEAINQSLINNALTYHEEVELTKVPDSYGQSWYFRSNGKIIRPWVGPQDVPFPLTNLPSEGFELRLFRGENCKSGVPGGEIKRDIYEWGVDYYAGIVHFGKGNTPDDLGWGTIKSSFFEYTGTFGVDGNTNSFVTVDFDTDSSMLVFNSGMTSEQEQFIEIDAKHIKNLPIPDESKWIPTDYYASNPLFINNLEGQTIYISSPTIADINPDPVIVTFTVPNLIENDILIQYSMTSIENAYMSEQRSYIKCIETGINEQVLTQGVGNNMGTYLYSRKINDLLVGLVGTTVTLEIHAFRTWEGSGNHVNVINDNSVEVQIFDAFLRYKPINDKRIHASIIDDLPQAYTNNVLYVAKNGNDNTGERGNLNKPYLTIISARTAAQIGDLIIVYPGTYSDIRVLKDGVNYWFHSGVILTGNRCLSLPSLSSGATTIVRGYAKVLNIYGTCTSTNGTNNYIDVEVDSVQVSIAVDLTNASNENVIFKVKNRAVVDRMFSTFGTVPDCKVTISTNDIERLSGTLTVNTIRLNSTGKINFTLNARDIYGSPAVTLGESVIWLNAVSNDSTYHLNFRNVIDTRISPNGSMNWTIYQRYGTSYIKGNIQNTGESYGVGGGYTGSFTMNFEGDIYTNNYGVYLTRPNTSIKIIGNIYTKNTPASVYMIGTNNTFTLDGKITNIAEDVYDGTCYGIYTNKADFKCILDKSSIDTRDNSIFSTQPINVNVIRDFHYTVKPNVNITLITDYSKFPFGEPIETVVFNSGNSMLIFNEGETTETNIDLSTLVDKSSILSVNNSNMIAEDTNFSSPLACNIPLSNNTSSSKVFVFVNGVQVSVGNLSTDSCYFSSDGITKKQPGDETMGDLLYWNYDINNNPIAGYELSIVDRISFLNLM